MQLPILPLAMLTLTAPMMAQNFDGLETTSACYMRVYDSEHLARNPKQTVTRFFVARRGAGNDFEELPIRVGYTLKGSRDYFQANGRCLRVDTGYSCWLEGDMGAFTMTRLEKNKMQASLIRMSIEGYYSFSAELTEDDNRVMHLYATGISQCGRPRRN
ncbi:MAG: hypothetical protein AAFX04_10155 [Pseudomonadota bacterium]